MTDPSLDDVARRLGELPREAWERPSPPAAPWSKAEADASAPPVAAPAARPRRRLVLRPVMAVAASVALLAAGLLAGLALQQGDGDAETTANSRQVSLSPVGRPNEGASGRARLARLAGGQASLEISGLRPSGRDEFYELWLLGQGQRLISLGSFRVPDSGRANVDLPLPVDPARFRFLDVSREPADGDPAHSTISVLRGPTA